MQGKIHPIAPVKASAWVNTPLDYNERLALMHSGLLPVNDVFMPMWELDPSIWILFGGRGGGKSEAVADRLISDCRSESYFKCYYGRKVFETVRGSCFETLVACIKKMGLMKEFHFSEANTSSMIITHTPSGNKFVPFGSDDAKKLKSIKDPTHIWCEEFPEFEAEDFLELFPTLRTIRGKNQFFATMNAYSIFTTHWIIKLFFNEQYTGEDKGDYDIFSDINLETIFANYYHNFFIDKEDYQVKLKAAACGNQLIFDGLANGAWGVNTNKDPWLYTFDKSKHVRDLPFLPAFPVYISFDFNNSPFEATAWQYSDNMGTNDSFIHCIKEFSGEMKIEDMCERIKTAFPNSIFFVTGDRSGQNEDIGRNQTLYQMIASLLNIGKKQLNLNTTNLEHADSRTFLNTMFANYPHIFIDEKCVNAIRQCEIAKVDVKSQKPHQLFKDRQIYKMDAFDSLRYFFQTYFLEYAKRKYLRFLK